MAPPKTIAFFLLICALLCAAQLSAAEPLTLYVAPAGNNSWSGTLEKPNEAKTDGPLANLAGAR